MILQRLYELADREHLLTDPAFVQTDVASSVKIASDGTFLGLTDLRPRKERQGKGKRPPKVVIGKGQLMPVPIRPVVWDDHRKLWKTTDPAASGKEKPSVFLADTIARVLPVDLLIPEKDRAKFSAQRSTFWRFLRFALTQQRDEGLSAIAEFASRFEASEEVCGEIMAQFQKLGLGLADICTFSIDIDSGASVLEATSREAVRNWWRQFYGADAVQQEEGQVRGICQLTQQVTGLSETIKSKINGLIPIGCRAEAYLVTGLQSADSYGLSGAVAAMVSAKGVDGFTRGLNALIDGSLKRPSSYHVGGMLFLYWTKKAAAVGIEALFGPTPEAVDSLMKSVDKGKPPTAFEDDEFYLLGLSGNSARAIVRDYLERPLSRVKECLRRWFDDLRIADPSKDYSGRPNDRFSLKSLLAAIIPQKREGPDWEKLAPDAAARLLHAALTGRPVPDSILAACLRRLRAEGNEGFRPARMALIKMCLNRLHCKGEDRMTATLDCMRINDPAYVCGQLLAFLARCQSPRDFGAGAQILERYFGSASSSPRGVLPTLLRLNRHHISKIRDENKGFAFNLEAELEQILLPLKKDDGKAPDFPLMLTLPEQGRFALGFYHQRAEYRRKADENKAANAEKTETK